MREVGFVAHWLPARRLKALACAAAVWLASAWPAGAKDTFTETYYLSTGGIAEGEVEGNSFKDRSPGPDFLPYTSDDEELPAGGNSGGTWTFAVLDNPAGETDHVFSCTRRQDDDAFTMSSYSDFAHGVFAEGEGWIDLHDAYNLGPSGDGTLGVDPGDDFEFNDRPHFESQSNWFWYNNAAPNQRGLGGSRYYFELRNGPGTFDEVQQWTLRVNFATNADDPRTLLLNEKDNRFVQGDKVVIKGLLIPVDAIAGLKDGELDPLFGWQTIDMARYVRDVLGPKLKDANLTIYESDEGGNPCGTTRSLLPPTYLMIQEGEFQVELNLAERPNAPDLAAYWGIKPVAPGSRETGSVLRWCKIMLKGDDDTTEDDGQWNPPIQLLPAGGPPESLWRQDKFVRQSVKAFDPFTGTGTGLPDSWGALQLGCGIPTPDPDNTPPDHCWFFYHDNDEVGIPVLEDCQEDFTLTIPPGSGPQDSWFQMPLTQRLDATKGAVRAEVQVRVQQAGGDKNRIQIVLVDQGGLVPDAPVAWADIKDGGVAHAGVGGSFTDGSVAGGLPIVQSSGVEVSAVEGVYTRFDLIFDAAKKKLTLKSDGVELFSGGYAAEYGGSLVNALRIWTESGEGPQNQIYVNEVAVLQEVHTCPAAGDTHCQSLTVSGPTNGAGKNVPGEYLAAAASTDDSGDAITHTFTAQRGGEPAIPPKSQTANNARFDLGAGTWTITVTVDDDPSCGDAAADAVCSREVVVVPGVNWRRCDANGDGELNISDPIASINYQFLAGSVDCKSALDCDGDQEVTITDVIFDIAYQFQAGDKPPDPYPLCDALKTEGGLDCQYGAAAKACTP